MSLMQNEFDGRNEVIFIEYNRVIKNADQFLLHKLGNELYDLYKGFLHLDRLKGINRDTALAMTHMMMKSNIFDTFKQGPLPDDWMVSYMDLYYSYPDMWQDCTLLDMGSSLYALMTQKFVDRIIIWSPTEDYRIMEDLSERYSDISKIHYAHGSIKDVLESQSQKVTSFILGDAFNVMEILGYSQIEYSEIMIAKYRFNQVYNERNELECIVDADTLMNKHVKLSEFVPATLKPKHFIELINKKYGNN